MKMHKLIAAIAAIVVTPVALQGSVFYVDVNGGGEYESIKAAMADADEGDTVLVAQGTYSGEMNTEIEPDGTNILLVSESGPLVTTIDGGGLSYVMRFNDSEDSTCVVKGFTIANGVRNFGGGISIYRSSPVIEDCIFTGNSSDYGGAVYVRYEEATPKLRNCVFIGNTSGFDGGALYLREEASASLANCVFAENVASAWSGAVRIVTDAAADFRYCTFYGNIGTTDGSTFRDTGAGSTISNCIFAFGGPGPPVTCSVTIPDQITHCVVYGHTVSDSLCGGHHDNMFVDPLFCNVDEDNFTLCANSPCIFTNNSWGERVGAYAQGCEECDAPVENISWGMVKSLFE
jgi:hypothetical protein